MAARKPAVYRLRLLIGGAAALVAVFSLAFSRVAPGQAGSAMFGILTWGVFIITVLDCIRCAGDALSWERREGTLGLLFLANLRGYDVVLGKFSSAAAKAFTTLVVTFPILALPLMMGGITGGEWARTMLALATTGLFCLSTALMLSAVSVGALTAMGGSLALLAGIMFDPARAARYPDTTGD